MKRLPLPCIELRHEPNRTSGYDSLSLISRACPSLQSLSASGLAPRHAERRVEAKQVPLAEQATIMDTFGTCARAWPYCRDLSSDMYDSLLYGVEVSSTYAARPRCG